MYRVDEQPTAPYRSGRTRVPLLSLEAPPAVAASALVRGAIVLLVCAAVLGWSATQAPRLAPKAPAVTCPYPSPYGGYSLGLE